MKLKRYLKSILLMFKNKMTIVFILVFIVFSSLVPVISIFSSDYSLDKFCNTIVKYNSLLEENPPALKMEMVEGETAPLYDDLYANFSYSLYDYGCARFFNEKPIIRNNENDILSSNTNFVFEKIFYPTEMVSDKGSIRMSSVDYYCFFNLSDLSGYQFYQPKFGADGFVFISDTFANSILEKNPGCTWYDIITKPSLSLLSLSNDDGGTIKVSINNIIDTSQLLASLNLKVCDDFCLIYPSSQVLGFFKSSSLFIYSRGGINGYKADIEYIKTCDYFTKDSTLSVYSYNDSINKYQVNDASSALLMQTINDFKRKPINGMFLSIIYIVSSLSFIFLCFVFKKKLRTYMSQIALFLTVIFFLASIVPLFIYFYYWWLIPFITNLLIYVFTVLVSFYIGSVYLDDLYSIKRTVYYDEISI